MSTSKTILKSVLITTVSAILVASTATPGYCYHPIKKFVRGITNIATFPGEIPYRIKNASATASKYDAPGFGFATGAIGMTYRLISGMVDVATCILPIPEEYEHLS